MGRRALYQCADMAYREALDYTTTAFAELAATPQAKEGMNAFLNKRKPDWERFRV